MKKFVTLSAIALAGATLGVGSTFGWWSEEVVEDPEKKAEKKTVEVIDVKIADPAVGEIKVDVVEKVDADVLKAIEKEGEGDARFTKTLPIQDHVIVKDQPVVRVLPGGGVFTLTKEGRVSEIEKLADQLEVEAKQFDEQGQKDHAAMQRKLAIRLRGTLKADAHSGYRLIRSREMPKDAIAAKKREAAKELDQAAASLKEQLGRLQAAAKQTDNKEEQQKLEAEMQAVRSKLEYLVADMHKRHEAAKTAQNHIHLLKELEQQDPRNRPHFEKLDRVQAEEGQLEHVARHLKIMAERLDKEGKKEEAQAIRQHAEKLGSHWKGLGTERAKRLRLDDVKLEELARREADKHAGQGDAEVEVRVRERAARADAEHREAKERARDAAEDHIRHVKVLGLNVGEGHLKELHQQLKELRGEIGELRDEVRKLRKELASDRREKEDEDEDDDEGEERDEKEVSGKHDDDDKPLTKLFQKFGERREEKRAEHRKDEDEKDEEDEKIEERDDEVERDR